MTERLPYDLPLRQPWTSSRGTMHLRRGELLRIKSGDGLTGWGDSAPWPEFGTSQHQADEFAEETALLDLAAQRAGLPLNAWLSGNAPINDLAVNGMLGAILNVDAAAIEQAHKDGFKLIKLKVGCATVAEEIRHLEWLAARLPKGSGLRLDANAAWSLSQATDFIAGCAGLPVEGLEEPLRQPNLIELAKLQAMADFPIGIDESFHLINRDFFVSPAVRRLVIKPARHGSLLKTMEIALRARAAGIDCIFTSSLESACGLLAVAHLAAAVAPESVHGLGTSSWFSRDIGEGALVSAGKLILPQRDGLGFQLQPEMCNS